MRAKSQIIAKTPTAVPTVVTWAAVAIQHFVASAADIGAAAQSGLPGVAAQVAFEAILLAILAPHLLECFSILTVTPGETIGAGGGIASAIDSGAAVNRP